MANVYTVAITARAVADSEHDAYEFIHHAFDHAKPEITYIDVEVVETVIEPFPVGD